MPDPEDLDDLLALLARVAGAIRAELCEEIDAYPGARSPEQARANAAAGSLPPLGADFLDAVAALYDGSIRPLVHDRW